MALPWKLHGDGKNVGAAEIVLPGERLTWPRTIGLGAQHVVAMFGATFLVPVLTHFPPSTTLLFSGIGTILFLLVTRNRLPSYLGSSFAFIAPDQGLSLTATYGISCYPNCDQSTTPPILNIQDFSCFLNSFASGVEYANCDGSTIPPILNVQDFTCFLQRYAAGCPRCSAMPCACP